MSDNLNISIRAQDFTGNTLRGVAQGLTKIGDAGKKAGAGVKAGATQASGGLDRMSGGIQKVKAGLKGLTLQSLADFGHMTQFGMGISRSMLMAGVSATRYAAASEEALSKSTVVFGKHADSIKQLASTSAKALGQSKQEVTKAAAGFGGLFTTIGLGKQEAAEMSTTLVKLATDLASFHDIDPAEVLTILQSGLVGETEPLRRINVLATEANVSAKALAMGLADANGEISATNKVLARYAIIMKDTSQAHGDFARTADSYTNKERIMNATIKDTTERLGKDLLPIGVKVLDMLTGVTGAFGKLDGAAKTVATSIAAFALIATPILITIGQITLGLKALGLMGGIGGGGGGAGVAAGAAGGAGAAGIMAKLKSLGPMLMGGQPAAAGGTATTGAAATAGTASYGSATAAAAGGGAAGGGLLARLGGLAKGLGGRVLGGLALAGTPVVGAAGFAAGSAAYLGYEGAQMNRAIDDETASNASNADFSKRFPHAAKITQLQSLRRQLEKKGAPAAHLAEIDRRIAAARAAGTAASTTNTPAAAAAGPAKADRGVEDAQYEAMLAQAGAGLTGGSDDTADRRKAEVMLPLLAKRRTMLAERAEKQKAAVGKGGEEEERYWKAQSDVYQVEEEIAEVRSAAVKERQAQVDNLKEKAKEDQAKIDGLRTQMQESILGAMTTRAETSALGASDETDDRTRALAMQPVLERKLDMIEAEERRLLPRAKRSMEVQARILELRQERATVENEIAELDKAAEDEREDSDKKRRDEAEEAQHKRQEIMAAKFGLAKSKVSNNPFMTGAEKQSAELAVLLQEFRQLSTPREGEDELERLRRLQEAEDIRGQIAEGMTKGGTHRTLGGGTIGAYDQRALRGVMGELDQVEADGASGRQVRQTASATQIIINLAGSSREQVLQWVNQELRAAIP